MQWFKSAMVISTVFGVAAMGANGCGPSKTQGDGGSDTGTGDHIVTGMDGAADHHTGDGGGTCTPAVACEMCDQSGYVAPVMGKPTVMMGACTAAQESAFASACFNSLGGSQAACTAWYAMDSGACTTCLGGNLDSAANWGAIHAPNSMSGGQLNIGGCADLEVTGAVAMEKNAGGAGSCGDAIVGLDGCVGAACANCSSNSDFQSCAMDVESGTCAQYATASNGPACATVNSDAAPPKLANCFLGNSTLQDFVNFFNVFCNTGP